MAETPLKVSRRIANVAERVANDVVRVLKASAVDEKTGEVVADSIDGFGDPETQIQGVQALVKAISVGTSSAAVSEDGNFWEADCLGDELIGDFVYKVDATTVAKANVLDGDKLPVVGIVIERAGNRVTIQTGGKVDYFSELSPGAVYFLGINGSPTDTLPLGASGQEVWRQTLGVAIDSEILLLEPDFTPISYITP